MIPRLLELTIFEDFFRKGRNVIIRSLRMRRLNKVECLALDVRPLSIRIDERYNDSWDIIRYGWDHN